MKTSPFKRVNASSMKSHSVTTNSIASDGHIPWRERLDLDEIEAETDDEGFDDLLMSAEEGGGGGGSIHRVPLASGNFQRHDASKTAAAASNWDAEFSAAQAHASQLLRALNNK